MDILYAYIIYKQFTAAVPISSTMITHQTLKILTLSFNNIHLEKTSVGIKSKYPLAVHLQS
jgi:hypothetical protein